MDLRPHHHDVATDVGRGGDTMRMAVDPTSEPLCQVDAAALADR
jgi:hypothetical protein